VVILTRADAENYRFLRLYSIDLDTARQACDLLEGPYGAGVKYCVLRDVIVTYARPFSVNRGRVFRRHCLEVDVVPKQFLTLHDELVELRNRAFAHTDHDFRNPKLSRWKGASGGATYPMSFANPEYERLLIRRSAIRELIAMVEDAVNAQAKQFERLIDQLYPEDVAPSGESGDANRRASDSPAG